MSRRRSERPQSRNAITSPARWAPSGRVAGLVRVRLYPMSWRRCPTSSRHRGRLGAAEVVAGVLILLCVVLHVVAMTQTYFHGQATLASQTDQAVLYSVLAAGWLVAFVFGLFGPDRLA